MQSTTPYPMLTTLPIQVRFIDEEPDGEVADNLSYYPVAVDDPSAVYLGRGDLQVAADGIGDDAPVIQRAIDRVQAKCQTGIVFIPEGTYRLGHTIRLWSGIRLIGGGRRRPTFVLGAYTPGFQNMAQVRYMVHFCRRRSRLPDAEIDAFEGTFYSGIHNIDFSIGDGNPAAVAVRFNVAQLSSLKHIAFHIGQGIAGIEAIGNEIENCRFIGGSFGIMTGRTSASWQSLLTDCVFAGQSEACIRTESAGLTVVRCHFMDAPHVVVVPEERTEQLYLRDCHFARINAPALLFSVESGPTNQINLDRVTCEDVPVFLAFRRSENQVDAASCRYVVRRLSHGLHLDPADTKGVWIRSYDLRMDWQARQELPPLPCPEYRPVPPCSQWVDVREFGAIGDGQADDTEALRRAVMSSKAIYLPMGIYRITDTIALGPETALLGLHGERTQIVLRSGEEGYGDPACPKAMLSSSPGGRTIMAGLGLNPNTNPGAVALLWRAGVQSLVEDVWFEWGGHDLDPKGQGCLYSLWVTDGGGGVFKNIWSANIGARNGLFVSDTSTPGFVYLVSVEHHKDVDVRLERVRNWSFYALQTEANIGSEQATAVELDTCSGVEFINLFMYRVKALDTRHPQAIRLERSAPVAFRGLHCFSYGLLPYDHAMLHADSGLFMAEHELALCNVV